MMSNHGVLPDFAGFVTDAMRNDCKYGDLMATNGNKYPAYMTKEGDAIYITINTLLRRDIRDKDNNSEQPAKSGKM